MSAITTLIKKHPLLSYYILTFTITWGGLLAVGGLDGMSGTTWQSDPRLMVMAAAMLAGPSVSSVLLTGLVSGRAGYRELLSRLFRWRVGARWYALALLAAPLVLTTVHSGLLLTSTAFVPGILVASDKASFVLLGIVPPLVIGLCEELGWTGFATPRLRLRHMAFATGFIVGALWGAWHFLTNVIWIAGTYSGGLPVPVFVVTSVLLLLVGQLTAYRVLMVWVYDRTGSLPVVMLMHASYSACTFILGPSATGAALLAYGFVLSAAWWVIVVAVLWLATLPRQRRAGLPVQG